MAKKLRPGKGAKAQVLTRFIKPTQPLPGDNKKHRSTMVLTDRDHDKAGKVIFRFRYETTDGDDATLLYANYRYVQVIKEGDPNDLFDGPLCAFLSGMIRGTMARRGSNQPSAH
jgi:hypothetical protein